MTIERDDLYMILRCTEEHTIRECLRQVPAEHVTKDGMHYTLHALVVPVAAGTTVPYAVYWSDAKFAEHKAALTALLLGGK